jgi:hypothetical protein
MSSSPDPSKGFSSASCTLTRVNKNTFYLRDHLCIERCVWSLGVRVSVCLPMSHMYAPLCVCVCTPVCLCMHTCVSMIARLCVYICTHAKHRCAYTSFYFTYVHQNKNAPPEERINHDGEGNRVEKRRGTRCKECLESQGKKINSEENSVKEKENTAGHARFRLGENQKSVHLFIYDSENS